jgi:hypothetical protein
MVGAGASPFPFALAPLGRLGFFDGVQEMACVLGEVGSDLAWG